jgi:hypothetical protein
MPFRDDICPLSSIFWHVYKAHFGITWVLPLPHLTLFTAAISMDSECWTPGLDSGGAWSAQLGIQIRNADCPLMPRFPFPASSFKQPHGPQNLAYPFGVHFLVECQVILYL